MHLHDKRRLIDSEASSHSSNLAIWTLKLLLFMYRMMLKHSSKRPVEARLASFWYPACFAGILWQCTDHFQAVRILACETRPNKWVRLSFVPRYSCWVCESLAVKVARSEDIYCIVISYDAVFWGLVCSDLGEVNTALKCINGFYIWFFVSKKSQCLNDTHIPYFAATWVQS